MFHSHKLYIQVSRNKVTVTNLETGVEVTQVAAEPFSSQRSILSSFDPANKTLVTAMRQLNLKHSFLKTKAVIQQMEDTVGGLTDIEKRALRDLAEIAGVAEVYIVDGKQRLTRDEALGYLS
jgi:hypothetical protein